MTEDETRARTRFFVIQLVRITGVGLFMVGLLALAGKLDMPLVAAVALTAVGAFDMLILPLLLSRKWKSGGR
ncbi:MAG: hypothetical protein ACK442_02005 [Novosphingobium sp.]|jgi:hypothetical protein|nr:hypothetical protein [Novosphingobium sp.]